MTSPHQGVTFFLDLCASHTQWDLLTSKLPNGASCLCRSVSYVTSAYGSPLPELFFERWLRLVLILRSYLSLALEDSKHVWESVFSSRFGKSSPVSMKPILCLIAPLNGLPELDSWYIEMCLCERYWLTFVRSNRISISKRKWET